MTVSTHRASLAVIWAGSFSLTVAGTLYLRWYVGIGPDAFSKMFDLVFTQYAPLMGAILGFYLAGPSKAPAPKKRQTGIYYLAITFSILWNVFMVGYIFLACLDPDRTQSAITVISKFAPKFSWFVSGAMAFYFGKSLKGPE